MRNGRFCGKSVKSPSSGYTSRGTPESRLDVKGRRRLFADAIYEADLDEQRATLGRFGAPDRHVRFTPDRLVLETDAGEVIEVRDNPRRPSLGGSKHFPITLTIPRGG